MKILLTKVAVKMLLLSSKRKESPELRNGISKMMRVKNSRHVIDSKESSKEIYLIKLISLFFKEFL